MICLNNVGNSSNLTRNNIRAEVTESSTTATLIHQENSSVHNTENLSNQMDFQEQCINPKEIKEEIQRWIGDISGKKWAKNFNKSEGIDNILLLLQKLRKKEAVRIYNFLLNRVHTVLIKLEEENDRGEDELFRKCVELANARCEDGALVGLQNIEFAIIEHEALRGECSWQELLKLGKQACREMKVRQITQEIIEDREQEILQAHPNAVQESIEVAIDPLEIYLSLMLSLKRSFDLPIKSNYMAYPLSAQLTRSELRKAEKNLSSLEGSGEMLSFFGKYPPWVAYLRQKHPQDFEAALKGLAEKQDELEQQNQKQDELREQGEWEVIDYTESQYGENIIALGKAREAIEFIQAVNLTKKYAPFAGPATPNHFLSRQFKFLSERLQNLYFYYVEDKAYEFSMRVQQLV